MSIQDRKAALAAKYSNFPSLTGRHAFAFLFDRLIELEARLDEAEGTGDSGEDSGGESGTEEVAEETVQSSTFGLSSPSQTTGNTP